MHLETLDAAASKVRWAFEKYNKENYNNINARIACARVISMHCAAVSRGIKKRAIFSHLAKSREGEIGSARPPPAADVRFANASWFPCTSAHAHAFIVGENRARESFSPFPLSPCVHAGFHLPSFSRGTGSASLCRRAWESADSIMRSTPPRRDAELLTFAAKLCAR